MAKFTMRQETYKKGYWIPYLGKSIIGLKGQEFDDTTKVGEAMLAYYREDVIPAGSSLSVIENAGENAGGVSLTAPQTSTLTKLADVGSSTKTSAEIKTGIEKSADLESSAVEIDKKPYVITSIAELLTVDVTKFTTIQWIDELRGGLFEYNAVGIADNIDNNLCGIKFNASVGTWERQNYSDVLVSWFGVVSDFNQQSLSGTDNALAFNSALSSAPNPSTVRFKGRIGTRSQLTNTRYGISIKADNTNADSIEAFNWVSGDYILDCDVNSSTTTGFTHEKFTINANNQPVNNARISRPYDSCSVIDFKALTTHDDYVSLTIGNVSDISQTLYGRNIITRHFGAAPNQPSLKLIKLQESKFDLCKFWGAEYDSQNPYVGAIHSAIIEDCRSLEFSTPSFSTGKGVLVKSTLRDSGNILFVNPLFEGVTGFIETETQIGTTISAVNSIYPKHTSPFSGRYLFNGTVENSQFITSSPIDNVTYGTNSSNNEFQGVLIDDVVDNGNGNTVTKKSNAVSKEVSFNQNILVNKENTPSYLLEVPSGGSTVNDTGIKWSATPSVDNGLYIRKSGLDAIRVYDKAGLQRTQLMENGNPLCETTAFGFRPITNEVVNLGGSTTRWNKVYAKSFNVEGADGASGSFTTSDSKTVTVVNGIITSIV